MRGRASRKRCRHNARLYKSGLYVPAIVGYCNRGYAGSQSKKALERTDRLYYHHPQESSLNGLDNELKGLFRKMYLASNIDVSLKEDEGFYESDGCWDEEWEICKLGRSSNSRYESLIWTLVQARDTDIHKITYERRPVFDAVHYMLQKVLSREWMLSPMELYRIQVHLLEITTPCKCSVHSELSKYASLIQKLRMNE